MDRHVQVLPAAVLPRAHDGNGQRQRGIAGGRVVGHPHAWARDLVVHLHRRRPVAGQCEVVEVMPRMAGIRSGLAEARDRAQHDGGIDRRQCRIVESEPFHDPGTEPFHHGVGIARQFEEGLAAGVGLQVERHGAFAAIELRIRRWTELADGVAAAGLLHLDHIGPELPQQAACVRAGQQLAGVDDGDVLQAGPFWLHVQSRFKSRAFSPGHRPCRSTSSARHSGSCPRPRPCRTGPGWRCGAVHPHSP
ncbi:hypothetical protein D3C81_1391340 [compost metagenome]